MRDLLRLISCSFVLFLLSGCAASKQKPALKTLAATELKPLGRFYFDDEKALHLIGSAVHFTVSYTGISCSINASLTDSGAHNFLQYELDGVYQKRIRLNGNETAPIQILAADGGRHFLTVYKATEPHTGDILIHGISAYDLAPVANIDGQMIEFIGNSITCGAAADTSDIPCGKGAYHDQHNAYLAYGPRVCRALQANYMLTSASGIGVYRNWNSDGPTMSKLFEKVDLREGEGLLWDFKTYSPKVVSIALGTNDFSKGDGIKKRLPFDSVAFVTGYLLFVKQVKSKYPNAQIALLSSATITGEHAVLFEHCLLAVKKIIDAEFRDDKPIATFFFKPMENARGCGGHPDVDDHRILADELMPFFKNLLAQ